MTLLQHPTDPDPDPNPDPYLCASSTKHPIVLFRPPSSPQPHPNVIDIIHVNVLLLVILFESADATILASMWSLRLLLCIMQMFSITRFTDLLQASRCLFFECDYFKGFSTAVDKTKAQRRGHGDIVRFHISLNDRPSMWSSLTITQE